MLSVSLLGDFKVLFNDSPITELNTPRLQSLFAYLLLNRDAPQFKTHLASIFWPDTSESQARTNLRNLIHQLRRSLPITDEFLETTTHTIQWHSRDQFSLDVMCFENAVNQAGISFNANVLLSKKILENVVALYSGDLLPACYDDWVIPKRETLRQTFINSADLLVEILENEKEYLQAITVCQRLLSIDPVNEVSYRNLMRLYALNGERTGALRTYHACVTILHRELDVEPSQATREIYTQLMGTSGVSQNPFITTTIYNRTVGRIQEWANILKDWRTVIHTGIPRVVMISGEAGIGKSHLIEDMVQWANRQGITICSTRCYAAEGELAFAPVVNLLRCHPLPKLENAWLVELSRLFPEILTTRLDLGSVPPLTEAWQRQRFFEALASAITALPKPLLVTIDDLQWCDRDTLEWLHFLSRFDQKSRILILGSYRSEEIDEEHPLSVLLQSLQHEETITEIELGPLSEDDTIKLAEQLSDDKVCKESGHLLFTETEGNPLFVVETVRAGFNSHSYDSGVSPQSSTTERSLPYSRRIQEVLDTRLGQLSPSARELAGSAAVIGRAFSIPLLTMIDPRNDEDLVCELDELWRRRILREHGTDGYDFTHDRLREAAYLKLSPGRRRLLHQRTAAALEELEQDNLDDVSHHLAVHYEKSGLLSQSSPYYLRAARVARRLFANEEALSFLNKGLSLRIARIHPAIDQDWNETQVLLWEEKGDILEIIGRHQDAMDSFDNALKETKTNHFIRKARLLRKIAVSLKEQRKYIEALDFCERAENSLSSIPRENQFDWWDEWLNIQVERSWIFYWLADWPSMNTLLEEIQPVVNERGSIADQVRLHWVTCLFQLRKERYVVSEDMVASSRRTLELSRLWGDSSFIINCQFELGFQLLWKQELEEAIENLLAALELVEKSGNRPVRTLCLTYLTVAHRFMGNEGMVKQYVDKALLAAEDAHMPEYIAAAKGNQAWLSYKRGDNTTAEAKCLEALELWESSPLVYPFQWQALWPLVGVRCLESKFNDAKKYVDRLLDKKQQGIPVELLQSLEEVARFVDQKELKTHLESMIRMAGGMGYL